MSLGAVNGEDAIGAFALALRTTWGPFTVTAAAHPLVDEPLPPGRYLVQIYDATPGEICWLHQRPADAQSGIVAGAGPRRFPLGPVFAAVETQVRARDDDALLAIMSAGSCQLFVSLVSTGNAS